MSKIDNKIKFISINISLITISDTRTLDDDTSGDLLNERIEKFGHKILIRKIIKDDVTEIKKTLTEIANNDLMYLEILYKVVLIPIPMLLFSNRKKDLESESPKTLNWQ